MNSEQKHPDQEPSLLDYIKSKLRFWDRGQKIELKPFTPPASQQVKGEASEKQPELPETDAIPGKKGARAGTWPWRSLIAVGFALLGQRALEPSPNRNPIPGLVFYGFSLAWLILAVLRKEWSPAPYPEKETRPETMRIRQLPLILGIVFSIIAFLTLGGNLFTIFNVTLWILAIIFFVWAFWQRVENQPSTWQKVKGFFSGNSWQLKVTRWTLLILAVAGIALFFRLYNLGGVPSEPTSDHAEKILDVFDVTQGQTHIFFPRNSGREGFQMYLTVIVAWIFKTGLTFLSLKIGTVLCGLASLPYMYLLGKELGGKRIGLLAVFFTGIAYWPNVISRAGLRFPLAPLFTAAVLFHVFRGLRKQNRNDFILAGLALGLGLHGYSSFRIMPFVVVVIFGTYWLHLRSKDALRKTAMWLLIVVATSLVVFLPLLRYFVDNPETVMSRSLTRLTGAEQPLPGPVLQVFFSNVWNALRMFNWDNGQVWPHSIPNRPALDVVSGALLLIGVVLLLARYIRKRHWQDLVLLISIPLLLLPSILSLAFPVENPNLYRTGGALVPTFLVVAIALDGLVTAMLNHGWAGKGNISEVVPALSTQESSRNGIVTRTALTWVLVLFLAGWSAYQNFDLVFNQFSSQYTASAWNSSEMGAVIKYFGLTYGSTDNAWIVPYPFWVDTRLPGVWAGIPNRDFAIWPDNFNSILDVQGPKLFIVSVQDTTSLPQLEALYPNSVASRFVSKTNQEGKDFFILFVPSVSSN
ncbi:MAG: glycosyltransferase family 39 protein [Anaerolineales bacterium]|jgi:4-amino-4-deoxy-L-arabinose transferase-like glycosyltransferase